jgi:S-ribosylhomocysteine lyase
MPDADHRSMTPPFLALRESRAVGSGSIQVWDLRVSQPNVAQLSSTVTHSLEHFLAVELRAVSDAVLAVAPMGCRTGFYVITVDLDDEERMTKMLTAALGMIAGAEAVPLANERDCGWAEEHSLVGAQRVAEWLLLRRSEWSQMSVSPAAVSSGTV